MSEANSEEDWAVITQRNQGRRTSLIFDDDYEENRASGSTTETKVSSEEATKAITEIEKIQGMTMQTIDNYVKSNTIVFRQKGEFSSRFSDIKFETTPTMFDTTAFKESEFFGIYILFWLATGFLIFNTIIHVQLEHSEPFFDIPIMRILKKDILKVALTDLAMYCSTYFAFGVQLLCLRGYISWESTGWLVQGTYDFFFLVFWLYFASDLYADLPWIAKIFLMLHSCVFVMKMHSYGFYNGYLWKILKELEFSKAHLKQLNAHPSSIPTGMDFEVTKKALEDSISFCEFELKYQSGTTINSQNPAVNEKQNLIKFPDNITLFNVFEFSMFPTLVYTLNFPRTPKIRWKFVFEKTCAIFGIIFLMINVAHFWVYPLALECLELKELPFRERFERYIFILMDMFLPLLLEYLLTFFLIWDSILNDIAELTCFADRDFYGPWWSCTDWSEFARIWNRPVHKFLLRHVYHSSISTLKLNKIQASLFTFFLSSLLHELAMYVIFGTLRGYLLLLQMSQIPMIMLSRTKFMRDKKVLGNVICWFGFLSGPSMICTLYLTF